MKKSYLFCILCAALLIALCMPAKAHAQGPYDITDYYVQARIAKNNIYDIRHTIVVYFNEPKYGITLDIPLTRPQSSTGKVSSIAVSDVNVRGGSFSAERRGHYMEVTIGDVHRSVTGPKTYTISYQADYGDDGNTAFDEIFFRLPAGGLDTQIQHMEFSITLPEVFDQNQLLFWLGGDESGALEQGAVKYDVKGSVITGQIEKPIAVGESFTMHLTLPQGYFSIPDPRVPDWALMGAFAFFTLISLVLYMFFGLNKRTRKVFSTQPPFAFSPPELAYAWRGDAGGRDIAALLLVWAQKGMITITPKNGSYCLQKQQNLGTDADEFEKYLFSNIFWQSPVVDTSDLPYHFSGVMQSVHTYITATPEDKAERLFVRAPRAVSAILHICLMLPIFLALTRALDGVHLGLGFALPIGFTLSLPFYALYFFTLRLLRRRYNRYPVERYTGIFITLTLLALLFGLLLYFYMPHAAEPLMPAAAIAATLICGVCAVFLRKRTAKGVEALGAIEGFRDYLLGADKETLQKQMDQTPDLFFRLLPYAYVLHLDKQWAAHFEGQRIACPAWYKTGEKELSAGQFAFALRRALMRIASQMTSSRDSKHSGEGFFAEDGGSHS